MLSVTFSLPYGVFGSSV